MEFLPRKASANNGADGFLVPMEVHPSFSSNALNGAKRLNGWNDLNGHRYCLARGIDLFLEAQFQLEKPASKLLNRAYFASFLS